MDQRRNPEQLLSRIHQEERKKTQGKLKIYLGAAPGVGKTHAMLQDAQLKRDQGLDVVIGVVESHGRKEIENLLKPFETIHRQVVPYHGQTLTEFDLDAALKLSPGLILIDEMAHTNAPGLRHDKRWQDIKELLDRGIDVYTTLNVQHIESLKDDVAQIIQAPIQETVPDGMIEMADTVELVDIPPDDLLKRLEEGKIYIPEQAELAAKHFFRKGNLVALRELALRTTAEFVGAEVLMYRKDEGIKHIWPIKERLLVCVGPTPDSLKLIRAAKRLATRLQAEWVAIYVDAGQRPTSRNHAISNLRLAEQLGAETHVLTGFDMVKETLLFARLQNITQIILWRGTERGWRNWFFKDITNEIVRNSGEIDVYIVTGKSERKQQEKISLWDKKTPWKAYGFAFCIVSLVTLINGILMPFLDNSSLIMLYFLGIIGVSLFGQKGPSILASVLSVVALDYFFIPPRFDFSVTSKEYFFTLLVMLVVTQVISQLLVRIRHQAESAQRVQHLTAALYLLSRKLTNTRGVENLIAKGTTFIANAFHSQVAVLLPKKNGRLEVRANKELQLGLDTKERSIAQWVYDLGKMAGLGTDTLSSSKALYLPLLASQIPIGVLRVCPLTDQLLTREQMRLLESCANQLALAIEVDRLQEVSKKEELKEEAARAHGELLKSLSGHLSATLKKVIKSAHAVIETEKNQIKNPIDKEMEQLSRLNKNLLQIVQLETHEIILEKSLGSLKKVIGQAVKKSKTKLNRRTLHVAIEDNLPETLFNETLMQEVVLNLIDNTIKYTPPFASIDISASVTAGNIIISVMDDGPGIVPEEINQLFDKFYRGKTSIQESGLGLGLAICQKIITAHGGKIWAENREKGGAVFRFSVPIIKI